MKIIINRSFHKTIQLKQFEPIKSHCGVSLEYEGESVEGRGVELSKVLDIFCQSEVEKTLAPFKDVDHKKSADVGREGAEHDSGN